MWNSSRFFLLVPILVASGRDTGHPPMALVEFPIDREGGSPSELSYAPRADRVAYRLSGFGGRAGLWVMERGAGGHSQVLPDIAQERYHVVSISPDGAHIAYTRVSTEAVPRVLGLGVLVCASGARRELPGTSVAWTPRGDRVAIADAPSSTITVIDLPSIETRSVLRMPCGGDPNGRPLLSWSPSGERLACVVRQPNVPMSSLWVVPADGGEPRLAMADGEGCVSLEPFWSPDGRLAWRLTSANDPWGTRHYVQGEDGEAREVGRAARIDPAGSPSWSPDGTRIVFTRTVTTDESTTTDLWEMIVATGDVRRLTDVGDAFGEVLFSDGGGTIYLQDGRRVRSLCVQEP